MVKRILIDEESAVNVLTWEAFQIIGGSSIYLKSISNLITSFCKGIVKLMGSVELDIEFGNQDSKEHILLKSLFNIVDTRLAYNRDIRRLILWEKITVTSSRYLTMKISIPR